MKQRSVEDAQAAVAEATETVIQQGDAVIEDKLWDAAEAAIDGRPKEYLTDIISGKAEGPYKPRGGVEGEVVMGAVLPTSIMDKIKRGEPLDEADVHYIEWMREHTARYALPLPSLLAVTVGMIGLLVYMTIAVLT